MELSKAESQVLNDLEFFRLKRSVTDKLDAALSALQDRWKPLVGSWKMPTTGIDLERGKIFRGENYRGYPYVIMDFPRHFSRESVFAVRTMCWWGHEFSMTLHLQGKALQPYVSEVPDRVLRLRNSGCHWCVNETPWEYEFVPGNYRLLDECPAESIEEQVKARGFLKIARSLPVGAHGQLEDFATETVRLFGRFLE